MKITSENHNTVRKLLPAIEVDFHKTTQHE